jgi:phosphocarrier protein FPr
MAVDKGSRGRLGVIGIVIVSHSAKLAEGVHELAVQMAQGSVRLAAAGGTGDPANPIGTDAFKVAQAIESVFDDDGVLVLMDLGSALLSADTALDFLPEEQRGKVRLCPAPLVEGAIAAVGSALAGACLEEIAAEAEAALLSKSAQLASSETKAGDRVVRVPNPLGLHARPAVQLIRAAARFRAQVSVRNASRRRGPVDGLSINGLLSLCARQGDELGLSVRGPDANRALAVLSDLIESGFGETDAEPAPPAPCAPAAGGSLSGIPASSGIAIGPLWHFRPAPVNVSCAKVDDPQLECERLLEAIENAQEETQHIGEIARQIGEKEAAIFDVQSLVLDDLREDAFRMIGAGAVKAEYAWQQVVREASDRLAQLDDPYLQARGADVADAGERVMRRLVGEAPPAPVEQQGILVARDLAPSQVQRLDSDKVFGLCLEASGANAHSLILARAMGIPAVAGLGPAIACIPDGTPAALDGERGSVWIAPDGDRLQALNAERAAWLDRRRSARASTAEPACTKDGHRIRVLANISSVDEARQAVEHGAEGVGVLRTEFLFLERSSAPGEDEQFTAYSAIASELGSRPLVIRTLDIGGDKSLRYVETAEEANPFLGWRGVRVSLSQRDLFTAQIRAILRAGAQILLPMVSTLDELRSARAIVNELATELRISDVKLGIMIEVPSAVVMAEQFAAEVDFFSIGTNDLIQYVMAADRTNPRVSSMADPFQPAVLRMLRQVVGAARNARIGVTLCGEFASDPLSTHLLIGLGLEEFSVTATLIPEVKQAISAVTIAEADEIARDVMLLDSSEAIREYLESRNPGARINSRKTRLPAQ